LRDDDVRLDQLLGKGLLGAVLVAASCGPGLRPLLVLRGDGGQEQTLPQDAAGEGDAARDADERMDGGNPDDRPGGEVADAPAVAEVGEAGDADGEGQVDIGDAGPCSTSLPFGAPMAVPGLDNVGASAFCVRLSPDELWASVSLDGQGEVDLYSASRARSGTPFGPLTPIQGLNSPRVQSCLALTEDGLTAYFESNRQSGFALWTATRASAADPFAEPVLAGNLNVYGEGGPYLGGGGRTLYFHSFRAGDGNLYRADRLEGGGYGPVLPLNVNTTADEIGPVVSPDELTIYFARSGSSPNPDKLNMFMATRSSVDALFGDATALNELESDTDQGPSWISPDNCRLYFHRKGPAGGWAIMYAERSR
jgi:hypothetical protein